MAGAANSSRPRCKEQQARHHRFHDTAYNLEPNVKSSPGGLRDIQTIGWVAKRHFGTDTLDELVAHGFLTRDELRKLKTAQAFLWKVRFALHMLDRAGARTGCCSTTRSSSRSMFGYEDASYTLAVEQFMQRYYRTVDGREPAERDAAAAVPRGHPDAERRAPVPLNARFQIRNDYLEVAHDDVFARNPSALLELFLLMQQHPQIARRARRDHPPGRRATCG